MDFAGRKIIDEKKDIDFQNYAKDIEAILKQTTNLQQTNVVINQDIKITPQVYTTYLYFILASKGSKLKTAIVECLGYFKKII